MSKDRPGIVADVAGVIYDLNGDLADLSQSVLSGFFSMIVIAQFNSDVQADEIQKRIKLVKSETSLEVSIKEVNSLDVDQTPDLPDDIYVVTARGKNRTGLVASIGSFCRNLNINIIDYDTKLVNGIYSMMLEIDLSHSESADFIHEKLDIMAQKLELKIVMQHKSLFDTVNEISLY